MQPETWKPPTATVIAARAELAADVERAGKLVRLDADERDHPASLGPDARWRCPECR